ncbi:MAG: tRNA (N6-isopentenyl adenosine(37)-C2)-methylthiotransferase MiaB, partial [Nanoarchaeota archaeon]|nr:tRNA (N6-isopentenyl adenosine(37)-C2)-methylthiotransferase MiaB [Nanoarchaeota archaeon]
MEKIYFETYGCALNFADSEIMMGILKKEGYQITDNIDDANLIIINTCTVKGPTDNKFKKR